ncbi:hypothetical protein Pcinc_021316 [Petrolisthes cinctipes]|uniref:Ankyrin repeat domain-containing protein 16 n=1 Tax=Petrolisthes cinctipes TaxID=88211 RepID=A0AAE1KK16_PETCI|nr:hypothetical protein Pcinc_021316 [Petrolisthes cinctipes]
MLYNHQNVLAAVQRSDVEWLDQHVNGHLQWQECKHDKSGDTVLHIAATVGSTTVISWLLSHGCDVCVNQRNSDGKTPLHSAAQNSHPTVVSLLLQQGAKVDSLKRGDWTPLMMAATKNNTEVLQLLINAKAGLHLTNKDGWSTFHIACREGNKEVVQFLLDSDTSLWNTVSNNGRTPLHTAALHGHTEVVRILLECSGYNCNEGDACGSTPLMESLRGGHLDTSKLLINAQSCLSAKDATGRTGFHLAAEAGRADMVEMLVSTYDMDVNSTSDKALHCAAREGHTAVVDLLLTLGADINATDHNGRTALWLACGGRKRECAVRLIAKGADDSPDHHGSEPSQLLPLAFTISHPS